MKNKIFRSLVRWISLFLLTSNIGLGVYFFIGVVKISKETGAGRGQDVFLIFPMMFVNFPLSLISGVILVVGILYNWANLNQQLALDTKVFDKINLRLSFFGLLTAPMFIFFSFTLLTVTI